MIHCRFEILEFGSKAHAQSLGLRYDVLRKPLGLQFDPTELEKEQDEVHLALLRGEYLVACLLLKNLGGGIMKMRQVAVATDEQGKGHGRQLVLQSEQWCIENDRRRIELHARETAIPFYLNLGYSVDKEPFTEVGIPHRFMFKDL